MKKFLPYDKRIRVDEITAKNIRDIMKFTGAKTEGEAVRNVVRANWQHLKEEQDDIFKEKVRLVQDDSVRASVKRLEDYGKKVRG